MDKKPTDAEKKRWFSTGYLAHGIASVDAEKHTLQDGAVIRVGEAKGHGMWIDSAFCKAVEQQTAALSEKGLKARFGHPDMCSDALGTFLGRWKNIHMGTDGIVRGNLHLSSTAAESPKGDLRNYIESMAAKEPDHFGTSIVFSRDWDAEDQFEESNMEEVDETDRTGKPTGNKIRTFKSPDPANTKNLRHARLSALHAADLVDDPAATDGMFSGIGGTELAARVSEWLDTHPEILKAFIDEPEMLAIVERYASDLGPFFERYTANHPAAEPAVAPQADKLAEPSKEALRIIELEALLKSEQEKTAAQAKEIEADKAELAKLSAELIASQTAQATGAKSIADLTTERDALAAKVKTVEAECEDAKKKLQAIMTAGVVPVSAAAGEVKNGENLSPWKKAQRR